MINFSKPPVFGFECSTFHARTFYRTNIRENINNSPQMKGHLFTEEDMQTGTRTAYRVMNLIKVLAYFPVIGTLIGLAHFKEDNMKSKNKYKHIVRGCIETLSLGVLFLIPDLIVTICRALQKK